MKPLKKVKVSELVLNTDNPRYITEDKFKRLVQSVQDFPTMLDARPIVVDENNIILGGNMRYKACVEAGYKTVPVYQITPDDEAIKKKLLERGITYEELKAEFMVKDNASYGDWDWDALANNFTTDQLAGWGLDVNFADPTQEGPEDPFADPGTGYKEQYGVIIICKSEAEQETIFNKFTDDGYECKIVVT